MDLLRETLEAEADLKKARADAGREKDIAPLLERIQENYQTLITVNPTLCRSKDINAQLWKICFYCDIEAFRSAIKATVEIVDSKRFPDASKKQDAQQHLVQLMSDFKHFLGRTSAFYNKIVLLLEKRMQACKLVSRWSADPAYEDLCFSAHRSLIYLGDISRYWEMQAESKRRNWQTAERCYQRALRFMPTSGHAHNQLAVTAMYADAELTALFHYCLSISIKDSFQSGISNLILFFKKNMKSHKDLLSVEEPTGKLTPSSKEGRAAVKATCVKFMRLHGILFEASRRHVDSLMPSSAEELESNIAKSKELDNRSLADFVTLVPEVMDRISRLAVHGLLSEGTLLKMVAISIFSAHRYVFESVNHEATPDLDVDAKNAVNPNLPRSTAGAYALILLFSFVNRLSLLADRYRKLVPLILTPLITFSEWVIQHREVLQQVQASALIPDGRNKPSRYKINESFLADSAGVWFTAASADVLLLENRARSGMRTSLVSLINTLDPNGSVVAEMIGSCKVPSSSTGMLATQGAASTIDANQFYMAALSCLMPSPIREFVELRGFTPVACRIEGYFSRYFFKDFKDITVLESVKARQVRLLLLRQFVDKVLSVAPLHTLSIPATMGDIKSNDNSKIRRSKKNVSGGDDTDFRRYPPGSSSAPLPASGQSRRDRDKSNSNKQSNTKQKDSLTTGKRSRSSRSSGKHIPEAGETTGLAPDRALSNEDDEDGNAIARRRRRSEPLDEDDSTSDQMNNVEDDFSVSGAESHGDASSGSVSVLGDTNNTINPTDEDNGDDEDEIIVFKPSFSRFNQSAQAERLEILTTVPSEILVDVDLNVQKTHEMSIPASSEWLGSDTCKVSLLWSCFGWSNTAPLNHEDESEHIIDSLRLDASSPECFKDDLNQYDGLMKSSSSDPNLWSTFGGPPKGSYESEVLDPFWTTGLQNQSSWRSIGTAHISSSLPQPIAKSVEGAPPGLEIISKGGPPPGFEDISTGSFDNRDFIPLGAPPGLTRFKGQAIESDSDWLLGMKTADVARKF